MVCARRTHIHIGIIVKLFLGKNFLQREMNKSETDSFFKIKNSAPQSLKVWKVLCKLGCVCLGAIRIKPRCDFFCLFCHK